MSDIMLAAEIADRLGIAERTAARRMAAREWPHTLIGRKRGMTEAQFQETLALMAVAAVTPNQPPPSGLSKRSRLRQAS